MVYVCAAGFARDVSDVFVTSRVPTDEPKIHEFRLLSSRKSKNANRRNANISRPRPAGQCPPPRGASGGGPRSRPRARARHGTRTPRAQADKVACSTREQRGIPLRGERANANAPRCADVTAARGRNGPPPHLPPRSARVVLRRASQPLPVTNEMIYPIMASKTTRSRFSAR